MPSDLVAVAAAAVALVLAVAAVAKLADRSGAAEAARGFGVPVALAPAVAVLLPVVELALAAGLLAAATATAAAVGAAALLAAFTGLVARAVAAGDAVDCHCFGRLSAAPVGWGTVVRNAVLLALAALVAAAGLGGDAPAVAATVADARPLVAAVVALAAVLAGVLAAGAWFGLELLRQNGRLLGRLDALETLLRDGAPASDAAPDVVLERVGGGRVRLDALRRPGTPQLVVFSDPGCGPCKALLPEVAGWQRDLDGVDLVVISQGDAADHEDYRALDVLLQHDRAAAEAFGVAGTPSAVLIDADGRVAGEPAGGAAEIRALVQSLQGSVEVVVREPEGVPVGAPVPEFDLPGLDGRVRSEDLVGEESVLVFWNPACGFCARMLDDLRAASGRRVVLVSTADEAANRAQGLDCAVALDAGFTLGKAFAAPGTPSAVLVAADGTVAAPVVVGGEAVLELVAGVAV